MTSALTCLREQCKKLQVGNNLLKSREKELGEKLRITEDMILSLKGRANSAKRYEEQLKFKCSSLERALEVSSKKPPTIVKVPDEERSSRMEMELMKECRKKVSV